MCTDSNSEKTIFSAETESAVHEARDIISGKIKAKAYTDLDEMI